MVVEKGGDHGRCRAVEVQSGEEHFVECRRCSSRVPRVKVKAVTVAGVFGDDDHEFNRELVFEENDDGWR